MKKDKILEISRNIFANFLFFLGIIKIRNWWLKRKQPLVRVLLVHHVRQKEPFLKMVDFLVKNRKYHILSFGDFIEKKFARDKINILLTFDDGYESWYKNALPVLEGYKMSTLWFINSGLINSSEDQEELEKFCRENLLLPKTERPLTKNQLKEVSKNQLISIGGHSFSHFFLDTVLLSEAEIDILRDKKFTEKIVQKKVLAFAYPFGRGGYSVDLQKILKKAGYKVAFTTHSNFFNPEKDNNFLIPRSNHGTVSPWILKLWVEGAFDLVQKIENKIRNLKGFLRDSEN